jgi:predicted nucleic acid-binding protein
MDPQERKHAGCREALRAIGAEPIFTCVPVLTECFHILEPGSRGVFNLIKFVTDGDLSVLPFEGELLGRAFELMQQYADRPMDLADAALVALAEASDIRKIFTLDIGDFSVYRIRKGHQLHGFELIAP